MRTGLITKDLKGTTAGKFLRVGDDLGIEETDAPSGGSGATTFLALTDTPATYATAAGKVLAVKADLSGIEFITAPSGGGDSTTLEQTRSQSTSAAPSSKLLDDELSKLRSNSLATFSATNTFNRNKVMKLGGSGNAAFSANINLIEAATGNLMDTTLTVIVIGNGTNTVTVDTSGGWQNENTGVFDPALNKKNVIRLHYIDPFNKFFTITQPV